MSFTPPQPVVKNNILQVPALNGTFVSLKDCNIKICPLDFAELRYVPSFAGNLTYLIIFATFLLLQIIWGWRFRTWGFSFGICWGLILEIVGYVGRLGLHSDDFSFGDFVTYLVCLTIAPAFISASIYLCLSRLTVTYGHNVVRFSAKLYTLTLICCDIVSLILQAAGGALAASGSGGSSEQNTGVNIMIAGLAFQEASLVLFTVLGLGVVFTVRKGDQSLQNPDFVDLRSGRIFRLFPWAIALATVTVLIRCCFRVAELQNGFGGALANNQTLFMIFEDPMIMIAVLALTLFHPGISYGGPEQWHNANWTFRSKSQQAGDLEMVLVENRGRKSEVHSADS